MPTGGPFSAQSADLRWVWSCKKFVALLCRMGVMSMTTDGVLPLALPCVNEVAPQQFPDNVMVAMGPAPHTTMYKV